MKKFLESISSGEIRSIIAVITVVGSFVALYLIILKPIPETNKDTVNLAVGFILGGLVGGVSGYYFGASKPEDSKP